MYRDDLFVCMGFYVIKWLKMPKKRKMIFTLDFKVIKSVLISIHSLIQISYVDILKTAIFSAFKYM